MARDLILVLRNLKVTMNLVPLFYFRYESNRSNGRGVLWFCQYSINDLLLSIFYSNAGLLASQYSTSVTYGMLAHEELITTKMPSQAFIKISSLASKIVAIC